MPRIRRRNRAKSKDARRIQTIDGSLHRLTTQINNNANRRRGMVVQQPRRRRSPRRLPAPKMRNNQLALTNGDEMQDCAEYIGALCRHQINPPVERPLACANPQPYTELRVRWRATPLVYGGVATVVFNPMYMWTDKVLYGNPAGSTSISTCYALSQSTNFAPGFGNAMTGGLTTIGGSSGTQGYSGQMRFLGAEFVVQSTTTEYNMGGTLQYVHGPYSQTLLWLSADTATNTITVNPDLLSVFQSPDLCELRTMQSGMFKGVLLPHTTEFEDVDSDLRGNASGTLTALTAATNYLDIAKIIPDTRQAKAVHGWNTALIYTPAETIADGQPAKLVIDVICHYHSNVQPCTNGVPSATAATQFKRPGLPQPVAAGIINNAYNTIRDTRTVAPVALKAPSDPPEHGPVREVVDELSKVAKPVATAVDAVVSAFGKFF